MSSLLCVASKLIVHETCHMTQVIPCIFLYAPPPFSPSLLSSDNLPPPLQPSLSSQMCSGEYSSPRYPDVRSRSIILCSASLSP